MNPWGNLFTYINSFSYGDWKPKGNKFRSENVPEHLKNRPEHRGKDRAQGKAQWKTEAKQNRKGKLK